LKSQDLLGIVLAIGITVLAVGLALTGESITEHNDIIVKESIPQNEISISRGSVSSQGVYTKGITNPKGESIKFEFIPSNKINLDDSNGFIRAKITYAGYLQQMERATLDIISANTGQTIKSSEIVLDLLDDNIWVTDVMQRFDKQEFIDNPDMLGIYILKISTENGMKTGKAPFTISMPSVKPVEEIKAVTSPIPANKNTQETNTNAIQQNIKISEEGFDISSLEPLLKEKISKTYLTKILKEYYAKNISKEDFVHLKSFEDLECNVSFENTSKGEEISITCNIKQK